MQDKCSLLIFSESFNHAVLTLISDQQLLTLNADAAIRTTNVNSSFIWNKKMNISIKR